MRSFGLIGYPLTHSFSKKYFTEKFQRENISNCIYELFEIEKAESLQKIIHENPHLCGLNVTIPHKQAVIPLLHSLDEKAAKIGAVNVIKITEGKLIGYNSDYYGFKTSLEQFLLHNIDIKALVLGTGGASKAVCTALEDLGIAYKLVSRNPAENTLQYSDIDKKVLVTYKLIINTTPVGMYPNIEAAPDLPYHFMDSQTYMYDLVYNPLETAFMKKGKEAGAKTINGLEMLYLQAEKAWEIWNR